MYFSNIDYTKDHDGGSLNLYHHHGWHAHVNLPENPLCWLMGHRPFVYRLPLKYNRPDGAIEYRWVECRICGRRSNKIVAQSPTSINYDGVAMYTERRTGWQGCDAEFSAETIARRPVPEASIRFHLGGRGSETPVDAHLTIAGTGIYLNTSLLSRSADFITHGKGRELKLSLFEGSVYWKLWVGEDHPSSSDHMRRLGGKYHSWACRDGSLSVRPLDYLYGGPSRYSYKDVDGPHTVLLVTAEGTEHNVDLTLQRQTLSRPRGPKTSSWVVNWDTKEGIPVRIDDWKGSCFYSSAVKVDSAENWIPAALDALRISVTNYRKRYNWHPTETSESIT